MDFTVAYYIAGISVLGLVTLWFFICYRELKIKKQELIEMQKQVKMHQNLFLKQNGSNINISKKMYETSKLIYVQLVKEYNLCIKKPFYWPGVIMGFYVIDEPNDLNE